MNPRTTTATLALTLALGGALAASAFIPRADDGPPSPETAAAASPADESASSSTTLVTTSTTASSTAEPTDDGPIERAPAERAPDAASPPEPAAEAGSAGAASTPGASDAPSQAEQPVLLMELADHGPVPAAFAALADVASGPHGAAGGYAAAPSCAHRCISSGVAYAHGDDVELVVQASLPVSFTITVVADLDHDGDYEMQLADTTYAGYTSYSWTLEDVTPGVPYYVMVTATDDNFDIDYAWGEFTL